MSRKTRVDRLGSAPGRPATVLQFQRPLIATFLFFGHRRVLSFLCGMVLLLPGADTRAEQRQTAVKRIEITQKDLTKIVKFRSTGVSVFGVYLDQPIDDARREVEGSGLGWKESNDHGVSLVDILDSTDQTLMVIRQRLGVVDEIALQERLSSRMPSHAGRMFDKSILDPDSPLRLELFGREDSKTGSESSVTITVDYKYFQEGLLIRGLLIGIRDKELVKRMPSAAPRLSVIIALTRPQKARQ